MKVIVKKPEDIFSRCCGKHISARYIVEKLELTLKDITAHKHVGFEIIIRS